MVPRSHLHHDCSPTGCDVKDYGNLLFEEFSSDEPISRVKRPRAVGRANERLAGAVEKVKKEGRTCVMLGGDHR